MPRSEVRRARLVAVVLAGALGAGAAAPRHRTLPILVPPSYATSQPLVRLKRLVPAVTRDGSDRTTLMAAAGALVVLALSSASLLVLTRRLEREVGRP